MTADRGARITIETERVLLMVHRGSSRGWCQRCGQEVDLVRIGDMGTVLEGVRLEGEAKNDRRLHLERAKEGFAVCLKSLLQVVKGARGQ